MYGESLFVTAQWVVPVGCTSYPCNSLSCCQAESPEIKETDGEKPSNGWLPLHLNSQVTKEKQALVFAELLVSSRLLAKLKEERVD